MAIHQFIQHPRQIPLSLTPIAPPPPAEAETELGLRLAHAQAFEPGQWLAIRPQCPNLDRDWADTSFAGQVLWCDEVDKGFELGVAFASREAAFVGRMWEQCCQIACYRDEQERASRPISLEQAAAEWIARHAANFPKFSV